MTRSQQELSFESGCPESNPDDEQEDSVLDTLTASPSRVLNRQSLLVRHSKGNPLYAKPVGIPIVPTLEPKNSMLKMDPKPPVSPHKINNFVYEEDNRIILDFGTDHNIDNALRGQSPTSHHSETSRSSTSLLAKMKEKKNTLKKSLSNVSNGGTLRRKKSQKMMISANISPSSTLSSTASITHTSMTSLPITKSVVKPSSAPPPPPTVTSRPAGPPPPPPPPARTVSIISTTGAKTPSQPQNGEINNMNNQVKTQVSNGHHRNEDDIVKPLEEFKIDLNTESVSLVLLSDAVVSGNAVEGEANCA